MFWVCPGEAALLHDVGQLGLVREEESQVRGENAILHGLQNFLVLLRVQGREDVVLFLGTNILFHLWHSYILLAVGWKHPY